MNRRGLILTPLALAVAQTLPFQSQAQPVKRSFRWVPQSDLALVDPIFTTASVTQVHAQLVFDTLYGLDADYKPHPQMAEGHKMSADQLTWTITLRNGLKFHDGAPVRAQDVVASIKRWGQRDLMGRSLMTVTKKLVAQDNRTLQLILSEPFPLILNALARQATSMAAIMPERLANTSANEAVKEVVGSGPFRFVADKWISGSRVMYERFEDYVPRAQDVPPSFGAGPKIAHVQAVQWNIISDSATAIAALQAGEVDGVENVDSAFLPMLRGHADIKLIKRSLPSIPIIRFNHLHPPFNNVAMRRAILAAVNQNDYMMAINGPDHPEYWNDRCGVFVPGSPMDSDVGMEKITGKRDLNQVKAAIKAAGYAGETIVLLDPVDFPGHHTSALVTADLFKRLGLNVDVQGMDWGTALQRRNSRAVPAKGGWNVAFTGLSGTNNLDPAGHLALRGSGKNAWFGWPESPRLEELRQAWFKASDLAMQKKICRDIQQQVFEDVPYIPLGAMYQVSALRSNWTDFQTQMPLFYTVRST